MAAGPVPEVVEVFSTTCLAAQARLDVERCPGMDLRVRELQGKLDEGRSRQGVKVVAGSKVKGNSRRCGR